MLTLPKEMEEQLLLKSLRAGEGRAQREFVSAHSGWMYTLSLRVVRDQQIAEDCVQEAFLQAMRYINSFGERSSLKTWLYRITFNTALRKLKKQKQYSEHEVETLADDFDRLDARSVSDVEFPDNPEQLLEAEQAVALVQEKIMALPDIYRNVLLLRDIEERNTRDSAEILGISENLVKVRLNRARAALKSLLEPMLADYGN